MQALGDRVLDLARAHRVFDHLAHALGVDHDLERGDHALAVGARQQALRDHAAQHARERQARLLLLVRREHRDDAVDRLGRVDGVQRRQHEVAGLGRGHRDLRGLEVAHLADQDHVGILAQRRTQRARERHRVEPDLALVEHRALVAERVLDRVLDRDDVIRVLRVDVVDHRGERGRLARAGRAGDEHDAAVRCSARSSTVCGRLSRSNGGTSGGIRRRTMPTDPRCWNRLTR